MNTGFCDVRVCVCVCVCEAFEALLKDELRTPRTSTACLQAGFVTVLYKFIVVSIVCKSGMPLWPPPPPPPKNGDCLGAVRMHD